MSSVKSIEPVGPVPTSSERSVGLPESERAKPLAKPLFLAKPLLKWAGGKTQLLSSIDTYFPPQLKEGRISRYIEPFVGGGAVFLHVAQHYNVSEIVLYDLNPELASIYKVVRTDVDALIECLSQLQSDYLRLDTGDRKDYFYQQRERHNAARVAIDWHAYSAAWVERAATLLFLNRTCFNGLFRVNSKGDFNVPHGRYVKPRICDAENLRAVSHFLQRAKIYCGDFTDCRDLVDSNTFVYFDPPYRPLSKTANFTAYSTQAFSDREQQRLCEYYSDLHQVGARLMLSNSDPHNIDAEDDFFDCLYADFRIERVRASRSINSDATKRGQINELLILNY
ncbi:DNA adenine methylase (dam) [Rubidibacter lacunae KORDI 51-2]|uniref:Site-specific DNA-methyltransferase (adenine-specific) n=1 Tax=Rubidibacter lacunae KORDI 51-2 TaxID=582515 RepID=U5DHV1_9CHRO|nr:DNA adenine methylase [Rubidibacter lacunae]ERN40184.1 DNA adenine methylase (dam) [Rubidibacter lacunae KORDI 51-2]